MVALLAATWGFRLAIHLLHRVLNEREDGRYAHLRAHWNGHQGKFFAFKDVPMEMRPVQRPHPPLWYGANSLESADRLAQQSCNTVVGMKAEGARGNRRWKKKKTWR